jgi:hypothetical protein
VVWVWFWCGFGVVLVWFWCGFGVAQAWQALLKMKKPIQSMGRSNKAKMKRDYYALLSLDHASVILRCLHICCVEIRCYPSLSLHSPRLAHQQYFFGGFVCSSDRIQFGCVITLYKRLVKGRTPDQRAGRVQIVTTKGYRVH